MDADEFHISVTKKSKDPYATPSKLSRVGPCGCDVAPCGFAIPKPDCEFHGDKPTYAKKRYGHYAKNCPVKEES